MQTVKVIVRDPNYRGDRLTETYENVADAAVVEGGALMLSMPGRTSILSAEEWLRADVTA